ncbi:hypothetical protein PHISCL_10701, partial [Aspergillus sclerotialis]
VARTGPVRNGRYPLHLHRRGHEGLPGPGSFQGRHRAVGLTSQRETALVWDWETGEPLHNAIAWPDTRTTGLVRELRNQPGAEDL